MGTALEPTCKSLSRHSRERPSPSRLRAPIPLRPSRRRSRTKRESPPISSVSFSLVSNSRMAELSRTTTSKRNLPFTWCFVFAEDIAKCRAASSMTQRLWRRCVRPAPRFARRWFKSINQMTRWVNTKEEHCGKIITTISEYCLCQRVKPIGAPGCPFASEGDFMDALKAHHSVMTNAMKAKQTVDVAQCDALEAAVAEFAKMYLPAE